MSLGLRNCILQRRCPIKVLVLVLTITYAQVFGVDVWKRNVATQVESPKEASIRLASWREGNDWKVDGHLYEINIDKGEMRTLEIPEVVYKESVKQQEESNGR